MAMPKLAKDFVDADAADGVRAALRLVQANGDDPELRAAFADNPELLRRALATDPDGGLAELTADGADEGESNPPAKTARTKAARFTDDQLTAVETLARSGASLPVCAAALGVTARTVQRWRKRRDYYSGDEEERDNMREMMNLTMKTSGPVGAAGAAMFKDFYDRSREIAKPRYANYGDALDAIERGYTAAQGDLTKLVMSAARRRPDLAMRMLERIDRQLAD